jgi:hypothetical protein
MVTEALAAATVFSSPLIEGYSALS